MTCLLVSVISYWFSWPHYPALFSLPLPRASTLLDMLGMQGTQNQGPPSMPLSGNALWYKKEAFNWVREYLPIGNGYLGGVYLRGIFKFLFRSDSFGSDGVWRCDFRPIITQH
jgi:hypothetical protein